MKQSAVARRKTGRDICVQTGTRTVDVSRTKSSSVTPSVLRPKQTTKSYHEHHVHVIMHALECVDKFLVTSNE